jgi:hypothetical protein
VSGWLKCLVSRGIGTTEFQKCEPLTRQSVIQNCQPECELTEWSGWSLCSAECGYGVQTQRRLCAYNLKIFKGQYLFSRRFYNFSAIVKARKCRIRACPLIDLNWTKFNLILCFLIIAYTSAFVLIAELVKVFYFKID